MSLRSLAFLTVVTLTAGACSGAEAPEPAIAAAKSASAPAATAETAPKTVPASAKRSPAELADLEAMCAAVDHDYNDGTLSDYFKGLKSNTPWGQDLQKRADESTAPGRLLLDAAREAGLKEIDSRAPACARLFEYIDDVE